MFSFDNTHIFTGYLKQLLSTFNLPTCKIYTNNFHRHLEQNGKEDLRILESIDSLKIKEQNGNEKYRLATRVNYLKDNELYNYFRDPINNKYYWKRVDKYSYDDSKKIPGLTKHLKSPGNKYDAKTHEYLGDYLRFLRDYYNVNLMSLYNCFNNKLYSNIYCKLPEVNILFDSHDANYRIYAFPVKLFSNYTIAMDSFRGLEMFCGFYNTTLELSTDRAVDLIKKTYKKINNAMFNQPFLYDSLDIKNWLAEDVDTLLDDKVISRLDIANREQDLRLFIKVPTTCKSSIVVLEGDFRSHNNSMYVPDEESSTDKFDVWKYISNRTILNFNNKKINNNAKTNIGDGIDINDYHFTPISKLQLLAFNTGSSYPFADRLIEYLSGSAITPIDELNDNIKRAQEVMSQNNYHFMIKGLWENKMQNIAYDYYMNAGPIEFDSEKNKLVDKRKGYHPRMGYNSKSTLYDILGYIDRDVEKGYASWTKEIKDNKVQAKAKNTIQNIDIYDGLYEL